MIRSLTLAAAALALVACNPAPAPDAPQAGDPNAPTQMQAVQADAQASLSADERAQLESLVRSYLDGAQERNADGLSPAAGLNDEVTSLQPGRDHRWQVNLRGGQPYRIIGACDNECANLDIELLDRRGAVVASDLGPDDFPFVNFTPAQDGEFVVRIMLQSCTVAPCYAGARVLQAPTT